LAQTPKTQIPNPQSPIPNLFSYIFLKEKFMNILDFNKYNL